MIQFFVKNKELVLPDDFSFNWNEQNPEITEKGEFSLDMTASLLEPQNAIAFEFLNRLNKSTIAKTAESNLIIDGIIHLGTIIVSKNTNTEVQFQFVSGNSELNYISQNEKKIWELEGWDVESEIDIVKAIASTNSNQFNFVCAPVLLGEEIVNHYILDNQANNYAIITSFYNISTQIPLATGVFYTLETAIVAVPSGIRKTSFVVEFYIDETTLVRYQYFYKDLTAWEDDTKWISCPTKIIMQPYLLYYINKLPSLIGYTIGENVLNSDNRAKKTYIINSVDSLKYADALPDMTISDFIAAVENFFNVSFVIDSKTKICNIIRSSESIATKKIVLLTNVIDSYERTINSSSNFSNKYKWTKITYPSNSSGWYKYQQLEDNFLLKCEIKEYSDYTMLRNHISSTANLGNKLIIYRDLSTMNDYFVRDYRDGLTVSSEFFIDKIRTFANGRTGGYDICLINKIKASGDSNDDVLTLAIAPAPIIMKAHMIHEDFSGFFAEYECEYQLPAASNSYYLPVTAGFIDTIEGSNEISRNSVLEVSLFTGKIDLYVTSRSGSNTLSIPYPFSHVDNYPEFDCKLDDSHMWLENKYKPATVETLKLNDIVRDYYSEKILDTSVEYTFIMPDSPDIRVQNLFSHNNLEYMPIAFERQKSNKQTAVLGKFYRKLG